MALALPPPTTSEILARSAGSNQAIAVASSIPAMTVANSGLPHEISDLMGLLGVANPTSALRTAVEEMLLNWRSWEASIEAGVAALGDADADGDDNSS